MIAPIKAVKMTPKMIAKTPKPLGSTGFSRLTSKRQNGIDAIAMQGAVRADSTVNGKDFLLIFATLCEECESLMLPLLGFRD